MNEKDILKALECHQSTRPNCAECPFHKRPEDCLESLQRDALELIKSQQTEIKRLNTNMDSMVAEYSRLIANAKSEAIREFAEKLKSNYTIFNISSMVSLDMIFCDINRLLKEMTGGDENDT